MQVKVVIIMSSSRIDDPSIFDEDGDIFLFDSEQEVSDRSQEPEEDSFSSPFVEDDVEWLRKLFDEKFSEDSKISISDLADAPKGTSESTKPSAGYATLSSDSMAPGSTSDYVSQETASTVLSNMGPAGMFRPGSKGKPASESTTNNSDPKASASEGPAPEVTPPRRPRHVVKEEVPKRPRIEASENTATEGVSETAPETPATRVRKTVPVQKDAVASKPAQSGTAEGVKRPAAVTGSGTQASKPATQKAPASRPAAKTAEASTTVRKTGDGKVAAQKTGSAPKAAATAKTASSAAAKAPTKKKGGAHAAPKKKRVIRSSSKDAKATSSETTARAVKKKKKKISKKQRKTRILVTILAVLVFLEVNYGLFVYSNIPFYAKWRTIYIETAMSTLNHQWLATKFIPDSVIQEVMSNVAASNEGQKKIKTVWKTSGSNSNAKVVKKSKQNEWFYNLYWELDKDSFEDYLKEHKDLKEDGYANIVINNIDGKEKDLKTKFGETIRILDVPNNLLVVQVTGNNYVGSLAICKEPTQVTMKKAQDFGNMGDQILSYTKKNVLAMNGSGFQDPNGEGIGGTIVGSFVLDGKEYGHPEYNYLFYGYKEDQRLYINWGIDNIKDYLWGIQFAPALIVNGTKVVEGSNGWGLQPRSAIGQTEDGEFLMLIVDGRQVGYSLGCTVEDCANIMERHHAYQAANLDGGSSSIMSYKDRIITRNSSALEEGRYLPNAIVVQYAKDVADEDDDD